MRSTLAAAEPRARQLARSAVIVLCGVIFITLCAKVRIPSWPVPMTLQTLSVMALALAMGPRLAAATFVAYLAVGAGGLPVFTGTPERGIGLAYMVGPTGGYLVGFVAAAWVTGLLGAGKGLAGRVLAMLVGLGVLYAFGLAWLSVFVPAGQLFSVGVAPFVAGEIISIAIVALGAQVMPDRLRGLIGR